MKIVRKRSNQDLLDKMLSVIIEDEHDEETVDSRQHIELPRGEPQVGEK